MWSLLFLLSQISVPAQFVTIMHLCPETKCCGISASWTRWWYSLFLKPEKVNWTCCYCGKYLSTWMTCCHHRKITRSIYFFQNSFAVTYASRNYVAQMNWNIEISVKSQFNAPAYSDKSIFSEFRFGK
jgi:hypothetical protein